MKFKYCIGFFTALFLVLALLGIGYQISYHYIVDKQQAAAEEQPREESTIHVQGDAEKNEGYYLMELHGFVVVYLKDKETIYELTEIPVSSLPEELEKEVREGKYIESEDALYGFLENYSS